MSARTEQDLKNEWQASLGEEKGSYYHHFWHQLHHLHMVWRELRTMLNQKQDALEVVNATIPHFWSVAANSMWKEVIVGVCGYSDPVPHDRARKPDSVSFPFWQEDHTSNLTDDQKKELAAAVSKYMSRLAPLRHARDKYLGHWNAEEWFTKNPPVIRPEFVEHTLDDIEAVLNVIEKQNGLGPWVIGGGPSPMGGAEDLLSCLHTQKDVWDEQDRKREEEREKYRAEREKRRAMEAK